MLIGVAAHGRHKGFQSAVNNFNIGRCTFGHLFNVTSARVTSILSVLSLIDSPLAYQSVSCGGKEPVTGQRTGLSFSHNGVKIWKTCAELSSSYSQGDTLVILSKTILYCKVETCISSATARRSLTLFFFHVNDIFVTI